VSALDRIAELHYKRFRRDPRVEPVCGACGVPWPCPTRRLCGEAGADADRLAAIVREADSLLNILAGTMDYHRTATRIRDEGRAALAAHDAARTKEGL